jgi:hypothetical protein
VLVFYKGINMKLNKKIIMIIFYYEF